jgi:hypothetical protein
MSSPSSAIIAVVCSGEAVPEAKAGRCEAAAIVLSLNRTIASVFELDPAGEHLVPVCIQKCSPARDAVVQFAIVCRLADKRHLSWVVRYAQCVGVGGARTVYPPEHGYEPKLLYWDTLASSRLPWPHSVTVPVGCWRWKAVSKQARELAGAPARALAQHRYTCAERCGVALLMLDDASVLGAKLKNGRSTSPGVDALFQRFFERHECHDLSANVTWHLAKVDASALSLQTIVLSLEDAEQVKPPSPKRVYSREQLLALQSPAPAPVIDHAAWEADAALDLEEEAMATIYETEVLEPQRRAERAFFDDPAAQPSADPAASAPASASLDVVAHRADLKARAAKDLLALRNVFCDDVWGNGGAAWAYECRAAAGWAAESERVRC